jgi:hypothetical protein
MKKDITKRIDELLPFFMAGGAGAGVAKKGTVSGDIKKPQKGARLIVVGKRWWHWLYKGGAIIIWNDRGKKKVFKDLPKITGMSWHDIERAAHKKYFSITPKFIEDLIKKELL